jgi:hypothetical protein
LDILFAEVHLPLKDVGELVFSDGMDDLIAICLKAPWDNKMPTSSDFTLGQKKNVFWGDIWLIGQITDRLHAFSAY